MTRRHDIRILRFLSVVFFISMALHALKLAGASVDILNLQQIEDGLIMLENSELWLFDVIRIYLNHQSDALAFLKYLFESIPVSAYMLAIIWIYVIRQWQKTWLSKGMMLVVGAYLCIYAVILGSLLLALLSGDVSQGIERIHIGGMIGLCLSVGVMVSSVCLSVLLSGDFIAIDTDISYNQVEE